MRLFNIEIEMEKKIRNMIQAAPLKLSNPSSVDWEVISQAAPAFKSMHSKDNGISEACHGGGRDRENDPRVQPRDSRRQDDKDGSDEEGARATQGGAGESVGASAREEISILKYQFKRGSQGEQTLSTTSFDLFLGIKSNNNIFGCGNGASHHGYFMATWDK